MSTEIVVTIIGILIGVPIAAYAIGAVWSVGDQVVEMSDNTQLQQSYEVGKNVINTAEQIEDVKDNFAFLKYVTAIALIIGVPATIIKAISG